MGSFFTLILRDHEIENQLYPTPVRGTEFTVACTNGEQEGSNQQITKPANNQATHKNKGMLAHAELTYPTFSATRSRVSKRKMQHWVSGQTRHSRIFAPIKIKCAIALLTALCLLGAIIFEQSPPHTHIPHPEIMEMRGDSFWEKEAGETISRRVWSGLPESEDRCGCSDTTCGWHQEARCASLTLAPHPGCLGKSFPFFGSTFPHS